VAFPTIIPSSALGLDGAVAPSNRLIMGAIGVGGQGTHNMNTFANNAGVQMIAVCDVDRERLEAAKNKVDERNGNKDCATYGDFRELLARKDIDAVCIGTPDHWHGVISVSAAKAGKDIYCEKPLVNSITEGRAVCNAVKKYGRVLQTGSHERSNSSVRYACELVRNGRIGELKSIHVNLPLDDRDFTMPTPPMAVPEGFDYDMWLGPAPWATYTKLRCHFWFRYILDYSGGEVTDRGAHIIDLAQLGKGADDSGPVAVEGMGKALDTPLFDVFTKYDFTFTYADGVKMYCRSEWPRGVRFVGSEGWVFIHIHGGALEASSPSLLKSAIKADEIHLGRTSGHHQNFLDSVKSRTKPFAHAEVGCRTATCCHLANIAMLTGRPLQWDPVREEITNDAEANRMIQRPMRAPWNVLV
jgi:predicted dehydrogenase